MSAAQATGLIVAGRQVMRDRRRLSNVDFDATRRELLAQACADLPRLRQERPRALALAKAVRRYYADW